ncbi:MAG TPA: NADH-quinone oxidoreductase subunit L [Thermaerobacter sp.]
MESAWLIPVFPLMAFVLTVFFGRRLGERAGWIGVAGMLAATALAAAVFRDAVASPEGYASSFPWLQIGDFELRVGFRVDNLEAALLIMVSFVSLMVHVFSLGYMHGDARYNRYFALISLFTAAMLGLVISDNALFWLLWWEIMGACSYLLIGHWFEERENQAAAYKAFITTRIGDVLMMAGFWYMFKLTGSLRFEDWQAWVQHNAGAGMDFTRAMTVAALLIFGGAVGKSAQAPLHVWLPDAMAGPTPVSALIHAATMVAAGVFLIARTYFIFEQSTTALAVVAFLGAFTAFLAATIAVVQSDIKKVLAYSTVSQLGYMVMALGVGGYTAAMFHLWTHGFFKALLFLGSGAVIHAVHTQNMHEMGGLARKLKVTAATFAIGMLALSGIWPFSGFYSKDEILLAAYHSQYPALFWAGAVTAGLTAFYMTRALILTFFGRPRDPERYEHAHEGGPELTWPLILLAIPAFAAGFLAPTLFKAPVHEFITFGEHVGGHEPESLVVLVGTLFAVGGILAGIVVYGLGWISTRTLRAALEMPYYVLREKWFFDWAYERVVLGGSMLLARVVAGIDRLVVDGLVNGVARVVVWLGDVTRRWSTGLVHTYMLTLFAGVVALALLILQVTGGLR